MVARRPRAATVREREQVLVRRRVRSEERSKDRDHDEEADEGDSSDPSGIASEAPKCVSPQPARRLIVLERDLLDLGDGHQLTLIRGSMNAYEMSTMRLTITNTRAKNMIPLWSTG